ncbi:transposon Ty3-I Gag-Pol polyprotein [Trichonephila clavipes]|nr:transposon Ty3-I Gag-Pol polyprotein [Trichonephila clavipes]
MILRVLCLEAIPDWEKILPQALFALRTVIHDSTGFSPAELVHGKNLRTPVMLLYEKLTEEEHVESSVVDYVFEFINRMKRSPSRPNKLSVQWVGPGEIMQKLSETNYVVKFPEKDKTHVYDVNMLKPYHQREENINLLCINPLKHDEEEDILSLELENESNLFSNIPGCTDLAEHDIELESERAIVAKPYRMSPRQIEILKSEVNKMLELKIIEPGESDFTSPLILVEAQGKEARPCIDYRRLNKVTRTQFFPLPNIEELLENVSAAKYISILDLTRGYWQIPLSPRAQRRGNASPFARVRPQRWVIAAPLSNRSLLKGRNRKSTVDWNSSCQNAFEELKTRLSKNPVLYSPDFTKPFIIQCDASNLGIGVVLSQVCENEEHPIMFLSKSCRLQNKNIALRKKNVQPLFLPCKS